MLYKNRLSKLSELSGLSRLSEKSGIARLTIVLVIVVIGMAALVAGQMDSPAQTTPIPQLQQQDTEQVVAADQDGQMIQSITFKRDMAITDALRFLAIKYQKNIVPTPAVNGMMTVTSLYNVTFEEALQAVIGINKFDVQGNFIMVYTPEEYEQKKADKRRMESRAFTLYYLTASEAEKMVKVILSEDGDVAESSAAETGVPVGKSISEDKSGGDNVAYQDTLVVKDYPERLEEIADLIAKLDKRPRQVLVEATILSAVLTEDMDMGVDLNMAGGVSLGLTPIDQIANWNQGAYTNDGTPIETRGFADISGNGLKIGISAGNVALFITALETITDTTIIANPKILAVNKQLGEVFIGKKIGYRENTVITDGGATQQGSVSFLDTGTKLAFRPYIGDNGYIRMQICPKISSGYLEEGVPQEDSTELATNIIVKDGQTIVIGGLFRDQITSTRSQVPLLGDIPIIGELFKASIDSNRREEIIILLTPHIIDDPDELDSDQRAADVMRKRAGARSRLNWLGTGRRAEDSYARAADMFSAGKNEKALQELNWTLHLRPSYLEAIRLRERILQSGGLASGNGVVERIMVEAVQREDSDMWLRY